jgi:D-alanyl-D-alanine carboxypeptidase-like protein
VPLVVARSRSARRVLLAGLVGSLAMTVFTGTAVAEPTQRQLHEQQQKAARLERLADDRTAGTMNAKQRLASLADAAGLALDEYVTAQTQARAARQQEAFERARYDEAQRVVAAERTDLGRFAASSYRNGGSLGELAMLASLLDAKSVTAMGRSAADLRWAGTQQSRAVDRLAEAEAAAADAAAAAEAAKVTAETAEGAARAAKQRADSLVAEQQALVTSLEQQAARARNAADQAKAVAAQMAKARVVAAQRRREAERQRREAIKRGEVVQVVVGKGGCAGADLSGYPNGQIPRAALCPLWGAEWHVLRADAAAAFNAMSKAYAAQFGRPILVTDSYRSYEMQVACRRAKGDLCATPGTSNHGWGTAVDLGDGVNSFNTVTHQWMRQNAPRFGWFHPSWAEPGGSKPEPWHWEFGG